MDCNLASIITIGFSIGFMIIKNHFDSMKKLDNIDEVLRDIRFDINQISFRLHNGIFVKTEKPKDVE